ncbi:hypothetical protein P4T37_18835 [Bacillus mobilis]|uniref:hypothetical protein n=2 Tax=Bacillus cereus group TaxID=86661 RepID=UPI0008FE7287|nr:MULTISPECIES: hypothetical protein [Bacillus cereus group]MED0938768.1 hypothetical protein [Bacillus mobilis]OJE47504.1 hypothetical protein BAQ44_26205 [Bacillus mobilis]PFO74518.1 hypothetical protein COJ86_07255 [Bacillus cereus]PGU46343.1 hypothetical protein COD91_07295 [Bacillus cereus]HDR7241632.1 hypothetical protein [Bacillus mobilis]
MKKLLSYLLIFSMVLLASFPMNSSYAKTNDDQLSIDESILATKEFFKTTKVVKENEVTVEDVTKGQLLEKAKELISSGTVKPIGGTEVDVDNLLVRGIKTPFGVEYSVFDSSVTTDDQGIVNSLKLFNMVFTDKVELKNTYELKSNRNKDNLATTKMWIDNILTSSADLDLTTVINDSSADEKGTDILTTELAPKTDKAVQYGWTKRWKCTQSCVASKGVNMLVIAGLLAACGVACTAGVPATAGTACYACVNSAGIVGVNTVLGCLDECDS